jgi:hypothetical protein
MHGELGHDCRPHIFMTDLNISYQCLGERRRSYRVFCNHQNVFGLENGHPRGAPTITTSSSGNTGSQTALLQSPWYAALL